MKHSITLETPKITPDLANRIGHFNHYPVTGFLDSETPEDEISDTTTVYFADECLTKVAAIWHFAHGYIDAKVKFKSVDADKLTECGQALFGNAWKSSLAEALNVDPRRITHWLDGTRPVPAGVWADIKMLAEQRKRQIDELINKL
jgi:hypothetical protein